MSNFNHCKHLSFQGSHTGSANARGSWCVVGDRHVSAAHLFSQWRYFKFELVLGYVLFPPSYILFIGGTDEGLGSPNFTVLCSCLYITKDLIYGIWRSIINSKHIKQSITIRICIKVMHAFKILFDSKSFERIREESSII